MKELAYKEKPLHVGERLVWNILYTMLIRPFPRRMALRWERVILRMLGAKIHPTAHIYSSTKIWCPSNLIMEEYTILGDHVEVFNVDVVHLKAYACVSQYCSIYPGSRSITKENFERIESPIVLGERCWVGAHSFLGHGTNIGRESVIGAGSVLRNTIPPYATVVGNPAKIIGFRYSLEEMVDREKYLYGEKNPIAQDVLEKNYNKYFLKRLKEIKEYTKL